MKVSDHSSPIQLDAYVKNAQQQSNKAAEQKQAVSGGPAGADKVELSDQARQVQKAVEQMHNVTDGHDEKVQQVKMEVENGTYKVPSEKVASDMLSEAFENDIILHKISTRA